MNGDAIEIIKHINDLRKDVFQKIDEIGKESIEKNHAQDRVLDNHATRITANEKGISVSIPATFDRMNNEGKYTRRLVYIMIAVVVLFIFATMGVDGGFELIGKIVDKIF